MTLPLLIASNNPGKLSEFQEILGELLSVSALEKPFPYHLLLPAQIDLHLDVVEDGQTYAENAALKARAFCKASGMLTLADDSGLEVDVLGGQPGLYSARYAPWPNATDADRRRFLLQNLQGKPRPWKARFHCSLAIASPGGQLHITEGQVEGEVIDEELGENGFGYDPVFFVKEQGLTMAQIASKEKNRISHRARAVQKAIPLLLSLS
jgi:XTP/dITP diphosphohydrolase